MLIDLLAAISDHDKAPMRVKITNRSFIATSFFAGVLSYALNHSVLWALWAAFLGSPYTVWTLFARHAEIVPALRAFFGA